MRGVANALEHPMTAAKPRVGFVGVGWIGRHRMEAVAAGGAVTIAAIADLDDELRQEASNVAPSAEQARTLDELLQMDLDAVVIATPSALHAEQSIRALESGLAVFCQKPLGRTGDETRAVVDAARAADRLLGVDLSYRYTAGMQEMRRQIRGGELGEVFAIDLVFHNAFGPGKEWFYDRRLSGGGCLIDLGIHLVDLALWTLDFPRVVASTGRLYRDGRLMTTPAEGVEDFVAARLDLDSGATASIACSWGLPAGCDAVIEATFYGTGGALSMRNIGGSYYDFLVERFDGRSRKTIIEPPDAWGGRAAAAWAERLQRDASFDASIEHVVDVARVIDRIYAEANGASAEQG